MYHSLSRTDEAIRLVQRMRQNKAEAARALCLEAVFYDELGRLSESVECLLNAIDVDPAADPIGDMPRERVFTLLGRNLLRLGRYPEAREWLRRAAEIKQEITSCWCLGEAELYCGQVSEAEMWWRRGLELDPKHGATLNSLGLALHSVCFFCWVSVILLPFHAYSSAKVGNGSPTIASHFGHPSHSFHFLE